MVGIDFCLQAFHEIKLTEDQNVVDVFTYQI